MDLRVVDNDKDEITVMNGTFEVRGWSYACEQERCAKMLGAREFVEGFYTATDKMKIVLDIRMNDYLCEMKPEHDDSITGFNEAWEIVRKLFQETQATPSPSSRDAVADVPQAYVAGDTWLIFFEDADVAPEVFSGEGAEAGARKRYAALDINWNCHLFVKVRAIASHSAGGEKT